MCKKLSSIGIVILALIPVWSKAQSSADTASYRKAQVLVNDGNAVAGRAIVDSLISRARPGTNEYAEGIFWRAVLSATAAEAEMDYRRIIVDYSVSPRVGDVLLRLAQLELARADYAGALQHLNRLTLEHPTGPSRARADYWTARVLFEKNDIQHGCAATADALNHTSADDTELRNQISYLNQRCAGVVIAAAPVTTPTSDSTAGARTSTTPLSGAAPNSTTGSRAGNAAGQPAVIPQKTVEQTPKPRMQPPLTPRDAQPSMVEPLAKEKISAAGPVASKSTSKKPPTANPVAKTETDEGTRKTNAGESGAYSVQVAAYNAKSQAQAMVTRLLKRGYEARVSGSSAPFRVRIGHYATEAQADAVKRSLKAKQIDGFVVKAESR